MNEIPHNRLTYGPEEQEAVCQVIRSGHWVNGPVLSELETVLAGRAGVREAVCVGSGSAALRLALRAMCIGAGNRVAIPAFSCVAVANAVLACDAIPDPVDVDTNQWNIEAKAAIELCPKAIIAVNTFGAPADIELVRRNDIPIIEDCAHGFGPLANGMILGARGDVSILSFYATKLLGAGEGGAILTNSPAIASFVREWRDYSDRLPSGKRFNDKMTDLEASLALCQLRRLDQMVAARFERAKYYSECLGCADGSEAIFRIPAIETPRIWYRYVVEMLNVPAARIVDKLRYFGVSSDLPVTDWRLRSDTSCPKANRAYERLVSLPLYPTLTRNEQDWVIESFLRTCHSLQQG